MDLWKTDLNYSRRLRDSPRMGVWRLQTVTEAKESFAEWIAGMLQSIHREGYRAPEIRRVYIPKPGKQEMRPLGVPTVADRALQRSASHGTIGHL